jgi:hypothetical protein
MLYWQQIKVDMSCDGMPWLVLHLASSHSLDFFINDKPIGALPLRQFFFGGGCFGREKDNAWRATDFREKRNPPQADSIVSTIYTLK